MLLKIIPGLIFISGLFFGIYAHGQTIVGMGTDNPNPNAVLELISEHQNQGFLMPRLTTAQRNASGFISRLSNKDNGLLVFDTDEGGFYYWYQDRWQGVPQGQGGQASVPVWYAGGTLPNNSEGKEGDFYLHQTTGNVYRKQGNTFVIVGNLQNQGRQYAAGTGINITGQNEIVNTGDIDPANELQNLSLSGTTLGLSGSNTKVDLSKLQDGTGTDNQTLSVTGKSLTISGGNSIDISSIDTDNQNLSLAGSNLSISGGNSVDISSIDTDNQTLSLTGNNLSIAGGNSVGLSSFLDNTDSQDLSNSTTGQNVTLNISGGTSTTFSVADNDNDVTNEIQDLSLSSNELKITNNAAATPIDLAPYLDNTDSQDLSNSKTGENVTINVSGGTSTTFSVADNDSDADNEKITSTVLNADVLEITEDGTTHTVDLSSIKGSTYTAVEGIAISGTTIAAKADSITIGFDASSNLKVLDDGITDTHIVNVAPSKLLAEGAADGDVLKFNNVSGKWEPIAPSASSVTKYYSVDPADFVSVNGASDIEYNGVNGGSVSPPGGATYMIAPLHLPHGSIITEVKFYVYDDLLSLLTNITCTLQSKALNSQTTTDLATKSTGILFGGSILTVTGLNITIDNSTKSYRIKAESSNSTHKVYGVRITYTETL